MERRPLIANIDALSVLLYCALLLVGLLSIYSVVYDPQAVKPIYDFGSSAGKQLLWIICALALIVMILLLDYKFFEAFAYLLYAVVILLLVLVLIFGVKIGGARAWFDFGGIRLQPAEFAKLACSLSVAKYLATAGVRMKDLRTKLVLSGILAFPALLILIQPDAGSTLVFSSFLLAFYREGLHPAFLLIPVSAIIFFVLALIVPLPFLAFGIVLLGFIAFGIYSIYKKRLATRAILLIAFITAAHIAYSFSVNTLFTHVLKPHQKERIMILIDENVDKEARGSRYNLRQSKIAIGSGGAFGKGYLEGTQTKLNFVPAQRTDFIFCTIGEEGGWMGSLLVVALYVALLSRIIFISERQKDTFVRVYGYSVAGILFFHFTLNISMTIGLFPVIGIPLPFISYGGSSLWSFTILLFVLLKLDAHRNRLFST